MEEPLINSSTDWNLSCFQIRNHDRLYCSKDKVDAQMINTDGDRQQNVDNLQLTIMIMQPRATKID